MASQMAILSRARKTLLKTLNHHNNPFKASISTFTFLSLEAQLAEPSLPPPSPTPLPPNPASGSPLYKYFLWMDLYFIYIRMLQTGKESMADDESYELVVGMLFLTDQIDAALRYVDLTLKSGYMLSMRVFAECVRSCVNKGRLDALVSIIERCKTMDQNKALSPSWNIWIARGENARGHVLLSVDEGLVVSTLGTAGRTYSSTLVDASWAILRDHCRAFSTLHKFETAYRNSPKEAEEDIFSPFTSLHPLVMASSKKGFETLDTVGRFLKWELCHD
ncbi:pentatricopeptide repeat-containing protein At1g26460, mitochondrial-like [Vitis vinifera]|uniref:pentatricopeptide repeat-containing protein At1g26460, mitochondrial-like n=1 Tax=Vitis vinifera TaxID=29760 RepID=UPI002883318E|nr:pentatricopeptide repeat-containing protein At1g26460, mitochondrial-like [Vitis vinifera]XP_059595360.1 pentatricopeptide repeat-containing protein At1g26460, mitochondrial-like [Vitis vinifera]